MTNSNKEIYLDYQATTPTDPRVVEAMIPFLTEKFGNAHSVSHAFGWKAEEGIENARASLAKLINANPKEIIFTSGATESNNLALKGVLEFYSKQGKNHLIISNVEHKCILMSAYALEEKGFELTILPVTKEGIIDVEELKSAIKENTALVSIMYVNNEIGTINPISEIGKICREKGVFFHTDAAQAVGKIKVDVEESNIDLMSISGHKFYGPKGIGAIFIRKKPKVRLVPQINGGGQERGLRSGTVPVFLCAGLGKAAEIAFDEMEEDYKRIKNLSDMLYQGIVKELPRVYLNGSSVNRVPYNLNLSFEGVEGESLLMDFNKEIAVSSGSACSSGSLEHSYVLLALGLEGELANSSIRFGLGKFTTEEEIKKAITCVNNAVKRLRAMSPLWEMIEEGIDLKKVKWKEH